MGIRNHTFSDGRKLSALYALPPLVKNAGYQLKQAFYTAMSMDLTYWKTLLTLQGGKTKRVNYGLCQELDHTWFLVEDFSNAGSSFSRLDSTLAAGLMEHIFCHSTVGDEVPTGCFHAKMAFLCYESPNCPDNPYYRIGVFSKNLTFDGDFQNVCVLDGFAGDADTADGLRLQAYLQYCLTHAAVLQGGKKSSLSAFRTALAAFDAISRIRLADHCSVYFNGLGADGIRGLPKEPRQGECLWDVLIRRGQAQNDPTGLQAVTKSFFIKQSGDCWNWAKQHGVPVWNCLQKTETPASEAGQAAEVRYADKTHMKLYWRKAAEQADNGELWMGSANFSNPALGRFADGRPYLLPAKREGERPCGPNVECLVQFRNMTQAQLNRLEAVLSATDPEHIRMTEAPETGEDPQESRADELQALQAIAAAHTFSYQKENARFRLVCTPMDDPSVIASHTMQTYAHNGKDWHWLAVPQSCFNREAPHAHTETLLPQKDVVVVALWSREPDEQGEAVWKCLRWLYVCPADLPKADLYEAGQRQQKQLLKRLSSMPWVQHLLVAETPEERLALYEQWVFAVVEICGLQEARQKKYLARMERIPQVLWKLHEQGALPLTEKHQEQLQSAEQLIELSLMPEEKTQKLQPPVCTCPSGETDAFHLKPYQAAAAARIIHEFGLDGTKKGRDAFVLADEAGLGKTYIALKVIAEMYRRSGPGARAANQRLNVYYMCSNQRILDQNGEKLKGELMKAGYPVEKPKLDRLSQAFREVQEEAATKAAPEENIFLYTMSASLLDTTHSSGTQEERQSMLEVIARVKDPAAKTLQYAVRPLEEIDPVFLELLQPAEPLEGEALRAFRAEKLQRWTKLLQEKNTQAKRARADALSTLGDGQWKQAFQDIREVFNAYSIAKNPPHLIILDEFHKMDGMEEGSAKALGALRKLICGKAVKQLYLSATPFRFTKQDSRQQQQQEEQGWDLPDLLPATTASDEADPENDSKKEGAAAFESFEAFVRFFLSKEEADQVMQAWDAHEAALTALRQGAEEHQAALWNAAAVKAEQLAEKLRCFMTRSERDRLVGMAPEEYGETGGNTWQTCDLLRNAADWQAQKASYLRQIPGVFSYAQKFNYEDLAFPVRNGDNTSGQRYQLLHFSGDCEATDYLWEGTIENGCYVLQAPKEQAWQYHPKLRAVDETAVQGMEQLLWLPPIRPHYKADADSVYAGKQAEKLTKLLVFSNYQFLPRALGSLFSETVLQRNKAAAKQTLLQESVVTTELALSTDEMKQLSALVTLDEMHRPELTCEQLVETLYQAKRGTAGLAEDAVKAQLWAAVGHPQVCLYRLMEPGFVELDQLMKTLAEPLAEWLVGWCRYENDRGIALLLNGSPAREAQTKERWEWYFYASPYENKYGFVKKNSLSQYSYDGRTPASNLWWWLVEIAFPQLKKTRPGAWKRLAEICTRITGQDSSEQGTQKALIAFAGYLIQALKPTMAKALQYSSKTHTWDIPAEDTALLSAVTGSFSTSARRFAEERLPSFQAYFRQEPMRWALSAAGVKDQQGLIRYCAGGNLQAVLEEYLFLCGGSPWTMYKRLQDVLTLKGSKVHILSSRIDRAENTCCARLRELFLRLDPKLPEAKQRQQLQMLRAELDAVERRCCSELKTLLTQLRPRLGIASCLDCGETVPSQCCQANGTAGTPSCEDHSRQLRQRLQAILCEENADKKPLTKWVNQLEYIARDGKAKLPYVRCSFSERYTADVDDAKSHNHGWEAAVQQAFNSPFWPMVLTTTSVAQEGLDFHQYCRRIMHYTLPSTPMALEQREGRIDRFRGYIQRLRQAQRKGDAAGTWADLFADENESGVIPGWVVPKEMCPADAPAMERILAFLPGTAEALAWDRLKDAKRHYRNAIGMPNDLRLVGDLEDICKRLNQAHAPDAPYRLPDLFPNLTPVQTRKPQ